MLEWIKNILQSKSCKHEFSNWEVVRTLKNRYGQIKLVQTRKCSKCGYTLLDSQCE